MSMMIHRALLRQRAAEKAALEKLSKKPVVEEEEAVAEEAPAVEERPVTKRTRRPRKS